MATRLQKTLLISLLAGLGLTLLCAVDTPTSEAQRTGGSMGGGSVSRGSSSGYSSRGSSGRGYSGRGYSGRSGYGNRGCTEGDALGTLVIVGIVAFFVLLSYLVRKSKFLNPTGRQSGAVDVSVLFVALDARARPALQKRFAQIAANCNTSTQAGLTRMLRDVAIELRRYRSSWLYVGAFDAKPMQPDQADSMFHSLVSNARSRYRHEVIRNAHGHVSTSAAPAFTAHPNEGPGLVLVTVAVAAHGELFDITTVHPDHIRRALEGLSALTELQLAMVEVVWTPAADSDRMSSIELETLYPHMRKIPESVAGKVVCGFCGGGFPAELLSCPHCGGVVAAV